MKKKITTKLRVAIGQVGLITSLLLIAMLLGFIPDRQTEIRHGRAVLAEAIVVKSSAYITAADIKGLHSIIAKIVERNDDLLSAVVRRSDEFPVVMIGEHEDHWQPMLGELSTDSQVRVPMYSGEEQWGQLELRFNSTNHFMGFNIAQAQVVPLILFMSFTSFFVFYMYLGKMLKQLDPTNAIPPRVRTDRSILQ